MSVDTYHSLHMDMLDRGFPMLPYYKVQEAKLACYPVGAEVSERKAHVPLQSLLQHTFDRIAQLNDELFKPYTQDKREDMELKVFYEGFWGFDGSTGQLLYKQVFSDEEVDESSLFATTFIPLKIFVKSKNDNDR